MKVIEEMLNEPAQNSAFVKNLNPIRVGLNLYRVVDSVADSFNYS